MVLISILLLLAAISGTCVALAGTPGRQVMAMAVNGFVLALLFMALQAPDVAFSQIAVGTVATPLMFLAVLASIHMNRRPQPEGDGEE